MGKIKLISRFLILVTWYIMLPPNQMKKNGVRKRSLNKGNESETYEKVGNVVVFSTKATATEMLK